MRRLVGTAVAALVVTASAGAEVVDRSLFVPSGGNAASAYSRSLAIVFRSPPEYARGCCVDGDSGEWRGPRYVFSGNASISAESTLDWSGVFERGSATAEAAARANLVHDWPAAGTAAVAVPHTVGGRVVGSIPAFELLTKEPLASSARFEGVRAIPLCSGAYAVARVSALIPSTERDSFGDVYTVQGRGAGDWNRDKVLQALRAISLDGNLPPRRIVARAAGRRIVGTVRDCRGHPVAGVRVRALPRGPGARTSARGAFALRVRTAGVYRITASVGGSTATSARVRVR